GRLANPANFALQESEMRPLQFFSQFLTYSLSVFISPLGLIEKRHDPVCRQKSNKPANRGSAPHAGSSGFRWACSRSWTRRDGGSQFCGWWSSLRLPPLVESLSLGHLPAQCGP